MTKYIVQHFVENLLKVLKVLKTRTALTMNGLAEFRVRSTRQGAKAPLKTKEQKGKLQNYYNPQKLLKNPLTYDRIESKKGAEKYENQRKHEKETYDRNRLLWKRLLLLLRPQKRNRKKIFHVARRNVKRPDGNKKSKLGRLKKEAC
jgi:hypothetical protein